jgi:orotate phosphoribosyltransferase
MEQNKNNIEKQIADNLLQIKAIKLNTSTPFTWASGWKSPIYCDNRKTLSYPVVRTAIRDAFVALIRKKFEGVTKIAGVATGAIAQGALVADKMELPFVYVRSTAKGHGLGNLIEGEINAGDKIVVIEDLISTGGSSLSAVESLREAGCEVLGMVAIFTYGFDLSVEQFNKSHCELYTLSNYSALIDQALLSGYIKPEELELLKEWRKNPSEWGK